MLSVYKMKFECWVMLELNKHIKKMAFGSLNGGLSDGDVIRKPIPMCSPSSPPSTKFNCIYLAPIWGVYLKSDCCSDCPHCLLSAPFTSMVLQQWPLGFMLWDPMPSWSLFELYSFWEVVLVCVWHVICGPPRQLQILWFIMPSKISYTCSRL